MADDKQSSSINANAGGDIKIDSAAGRDLIKETTNIVLPARPLIKIELGLTAGIVVVIVALLVGGKGPGPTNTATHTPTPTNTATHTLTPTNTATPTVTNTPSPTPMQPPCEEVLTKTKVWQGHLSVSCDTAIKKIGEASLKLTASEFSIVEAYSPLIKVKPNQPYRVYYWIKTDLELEIDSANPPDLYGKVMVAQYPAEAQESDDITLNRLDPGFELGESLGGQNDWITKEYNFRTKSNTAYVRLRAVIGGRIGAARGSIWLDQVTMNQE